MMSFGDGNLHISVERMSHEIAVYKFLVRKMDECRHEPKCCNCKYHGDGRCMSGIDDMMSELGIGESW